VPTRCLFYASNGHGLGHLIRTLAVARALRASKPDLDIMFVTNSEACQLAWREGFQVVKLLSPPANFMDLDIPAREELRRINRGIVYAVLKGFTPDLVVVDFFPLGQIGDMMPLHSHAARKVFIARERNAAAEIATHAPLIESLYNLVLIPHQASEVDGRKPANVKTVYTGAIMIRSRDEALSREQARARLGLAPGAFTVFVGFGGGGNPAYDTVQQWVLEQAGAARNWTFAVARPPLLRSQSTVAPQGATKEISYMPMAECWTAFDAAISTLGYNSTAELLHHGVPTIFVELAGGLDDWAKRAGRIAKADAGLPIKAFDTEGLQLQLEQLADPARRQTLAGNARDLVPANGARLAADAILEIAP
jgi:UDP-N-acetylglucosamine--N-acetylmuramyl-(pentapeptide) pyrophosphoryl-undecaprenol N-acetylglucosamine transferase